MFSRNLNGHFSVRSFVGLVVSNTVGLGVGILSRFYVGNILLLKLLRISSLALRNNLACFRKYFLPLVFYLYQYPVIHSRTHFLFHQHLLMTKFPLVYLLEKE